ncbi:hypothetical protein Bca4012_010361 [Brassica carinata]
MKITKEWKEVEKVRNRNKTMEELKMWIMKVTSTDNNINEDKDTLPFVCLICRLQRALREYSFHQMQAILCENCALSLWFS